MLILVSIVVQQLGVVFGILRVGDREFDRAATVTVMIVMVNVVIMRVVEACVQIRVAIVDVEVVSVGVWLADVQGFVGGWLVESAVAWEEDL